MENNNKKIFNLLLIDESSSMGSVRKQTISGFNEILQSIQSLQSEFEGQAQFVSMYSFSNSDLRKIHDLTDVTSVKMLDNSTYNPSGSTPLLDAIGQSVSALEKQIETIARVEGPDFSYQVLVTILTDGEENSSRKFTFDQIKKMIDRLQEGDWTFTYIGTDHDIMQQSSAIGINHVMNFSKDDAGMFDMLMKEKEARRVFNESYYKSNSKPLSKFFKDEQDGGNTTPIKAPKINDNGPIGDPIPEGSKSLFKRIFGS
jgi:uncharacterized protein YegL